MSKTGYFIMSAILFVLAIGFATCGILLFMGLPDGYVAGVNSTAKQDLMGTGLVFCFIFAIGCLAGAIGMLAIGLSHKEYY